MRRRWDAIALAVDGTEIERRSFFTRRAARRHVAKHPPTTPLPRREMWSWQVIWTKPFETRSLPPGR